MLELNPLYYKKSHVWKYHLTFFFCNFTKDFISFWRCSTKEAALRKEPHNPSLKLVSAVFYQIFIFSLNYSLYFI